MYQTKKSLPQGLTKKAPLEYYNRVREFSDFEGTWHDWEKQKHTNGYYKARFLKAVESIELKPRSSILELACQDGKTAFWLADRYKESYISVIDAMPEMVNFVKRINTCSRIDDFKVGDIAELAKYYEQDYFDLISCIDVVEHLEQDVLRGMVESSFEVLKPNGRMIVFASKVELPEHINFIDDSELIDMFEDAGFFCYRQNLIMGCNFLYMLKR